jgi:PAS domain S-box-containing protein
MPEGPAGNNTHDRGRGPTAAGKTSVEETIRMTAKNSARWRMSRPQRMPGQGRRLLCVLVVGGFYFSCILAIDLGPVFGLSAWALPDSLRTTFTVVALLLAPVVAYSLWSVVRRRPQNGAEEAVRRIEAVLEASPEWFWSIDAAGIFTYSSPACTGLLGYTPGELVGRPCRGVIEDHDLAAAAKKLETLNGRERCWAGLIAACRHRDGSTVWVETIGGPRRDGSGGIAGFDGTSRLLGQGGLVLIAAESARERVEKVLAQRLLITAFQPIRPLATGEVIGVEALTRFISERSQTPDLWFADAETAGLGIELELLAARTALTAAEELPEHLYVAVNLSPAACLDPRTQDLLLRAGLPAARIVLELTEHAAVSDYTVLSAAIATIRGTGVRIAVDDAGAGFASLRHILELKPDFIKLDRAIIAGIGTDAHKQALVGALAGFAARTGTRIIAEGIEDAEELAALRGAGIHAGQGYYLGRPTIQPQDWASWQPGPLITEQHQR